LIVNPNNNEEMADAIKKALELPGLERVEKTRIMQKRIERYDVLKWAEDFVGKLKSTKKLQKETHTRMLKTEETEKLKNNYTKSSRRLFFLDYDGTLTPFFERPEYAAPNDDVLGLLESLCSDKKNEVVLISGREKETLNKWFGHLDINIISEHGVWMKKKQKPWKMLEPLKNDWKDEIREILELHVDRTPGSFIEEKEFSLVFHYRKVDPEIGSVRVSELRDNLLGLTSNKNLQVLEGHKVIDIKNFEINKGHAVMKWISKNDWDFVLSVGDDVTDEDMFSVMPENAYSIKVGLQLTCARYNIKSPVEVLSLLKKLVE